MMTAFLTSLVVVLCFMVGGYYEFFTQEIDAEPELIAEEILHEEGIDIDFSAKKKEALANKKVVDTQASQVSDSSKKDN